MAIDVPSLVAGIVMGVVLYGFLDVFVVPAYGRWLRVHDVRRR